MAVGVGAGRRWAPVVAACAAVSVFVATSLVSTLVDHKPLGSGYFGVGFVAATLVVGLIIARHRPHNPIGWLMLGLPISVGGFLLAQELALAAHRHHPLAAVFCGITGELLYYAFIFSAPLVVLFFPDGRLPSHRWRPALRAYLILGLGIALVTVGWGVSIATRNSWHFDATGNLAGSGPPAVVNLLTIVFVAGSLVLALSWVIRRIASYRRSTPAVRQQYKWLAVGAVCLLAALVVSFLTSGGHSTFVYVRSALTGLLFLPFPVTIGIAILRYRLYDIDRLISRTASYALLTGMLVGLYAGIVTFVTRVLPFSSSVGVAASTLLAAAAFNPLRKRLQRQVDRRFNRARYNAQAIVSAFSERLRTAVNLGGVEDDFVTAVNRALEPSAVGLWLRQGAVPQAAADDGGRRSRFKSRA
jgi:hypothetical protein